MTIGERIQLVRRTAGFSQKELGERLGVSGSMIGQYENNLRRPKRETLEKIAKALNVSWEDLAGERAFEYTYGRKAYDLIHSAVDPRKAIHTLLKTLYGRFEGKIIESPDGDHVYYCVGKNDDKFYLLGESMTDILELVLKFLSVVVEPMKITGPEDAIKAAYQTALDTLQKQNEEEGQG